MNDVERAAGWYRQSWTKPGHVSTHYLRYTGKSWLCGGVPVLVKDRELIGPLPTPEFASPALCRSCVSLATGRTQAEQMPSYLAGYRDFGGTS